ncbi:MAG: hypothetical protein IKW13_07935, partial [Thermoguttaceae bacterium]|nr:hypothetical protein [Thermoguttaceae bacterium]
MNKITTAQVLRKDGTFVQVSSWKDLERLARAGEIDDYSTVVADGFTGAVGKLERDFFAVDAETVALRVLSIVAVVLALALGVAILVKATRRSSTEKADSPSAVATVDLVDAEADVDNPSGVKTIVFDDQIDAESDAADPFDAGADAAETDPTDVDDSVDAETAAAERLAVELGMQFLAAAGVLDEAKRDLFRNVADAEANLKKSLDEKKGEGRLPTPLRKRTAYPGL